VTNYIKSTDFAVKDTLITGNPAKLVKGTEINTEFVAIQTADATSVKGPVTATTDNAITRFDGVSGMLVQNSTVTVGDTGVVSGVAAGAAATDATNVTQVQNSATQTIGSVAGTNTITGSLSPAITAYAAGQTFRFVAAGANTGAATININGLGAKDVTKSGSTALAVGDIPSGAAVQIQYDGTRFQLSSGAGGGNGATNLFAQTSLTVPAGTGQSLVGTVTFSGTLTVNGRLVIL